MPPHDALAHGDPLLPYSSPTWSGTELFADRSLAPESFSSRARSLRIRQAPGLGFAARRVRLESAGQRPPPAKTARWGFLPMTNSAAGSEQRVDLFVGFPYFAGRLRA